MPSAIRLLFVITALLAAGLACDLGSPSLSLEGLRLARDSGGESVASTFSPGDSFYVVGEIRNAPAGTQVEARWLYVAVAGEQPGSLVFEQVLDDFSEQTYYRKIYFQLSREDPWPPGEYKVDIYLNKNLVNSLPFSVR
jgi:hypothetical protein